MKIDFLAMKNGKEMLLYEQNTNLNDFFLAWPEYSSYYTNNFDIGSEFVRISELEKNDFLFDDDNDPVLIFVQTPYTKGVCELHGKRDFPLRRVNSFSYSVTGNNYLDILDRLIAIENLITGAP